MRANSRKVVNESTIRKSAAASPNNNPEIRVTMGVRCVAWCAVLMFANLAVAFAQSPCPGIHVKIPDIRNSTGTVACAHFESPVGFPTEFLHSATNVTVINIWKTQARCDFEDIPPGTYAIAVSRNAERPRPMLRMTCLGMTRW